MKVALDSNILIYAEGLLEDHRNGFAQTIIAKIPADQIIIPVQSVTETLYWLLKKAKLTRLEATERANLWLSNYVPQAVTQDAMRSALDLVSVHQLQVFDAVILACAGEAGADMLLSEDMQHGFRWRGVTVVNPFLAAPHPLLTALIAS